MESVQVSEHQVEEQEEKKIEESLVYGRDEYAKKEFWDDRFRE